MRILTVQFVFFFLSALLHAQSKTVLVVVPYEDTYYSEFRVMTEALLTSGYSVDVRSARGDSASVYMIPSGTTISETAATLPGGSYAQFQAQFESMFGRSWDGRHDAVTPFIRLTGRLSQVSDMQAYAALVVVGGTGALAYRIDGEYATQGSGTRTLAADSVKTFAEKLQSLALDALVRGKPVLAQCHAASLPAFWRVPGSAGSGAETLGISLLKNQPAAGFPEQETAGTLSALSVIYRPDDRVVVASPTAAFSDNGRGASKLITTRDWYPQTVAYAARTLLNMLETYPAVAKTEPVRVLLLHGGAVNPDNCGPGNRANDVPCNYGGGENLPADYTHLHAVFETRHADSVRFSVDDWNLLQRVLPATAPEILAQLNAYDAVVFFKHWSNGLSDALLDALISYADNGGGVLALHHGLYNDIDGPRSKNKLVQQLFQAESAMNTWSANLTTFRFIQTNYGHFVTTFRVENSVAEQAPGFWFPSPPVAGSSLSFSSYSGFSLYDELYNNLTFTPEAQFGRGVNRILPLLSTNQTPASQSHAAGFVREVDLNLDGKTGRVFFATAGERRTTFLPGGAYAQVVRNAAVWAAGGQKEVPATAERPNDKPGRFGISNVFPNPFNPQTSIMYTMPESGQIDLAVYDINGRRVAELERAVKVAGTHSVSFHASGLASGVYVVRAVAGNKVDQRKILLVK
jgi:putative intracellular protease/amidase